MLPLQQQMQLGNPQQQIPPPPPQQQIPNPNELSLAGVLHFLQTEWRRYERERNEWEIERAEMRARIALLEGERRSFENIKIDLLRRVKMMEYALRVERSKQLQQSGTSAPSGKPPSVKDEPQHEVVTNLKEGSGSNSPHSEDVGLPNENRLSIGSMPNGGPTAPKASQQTSKDWGIAIAPHRGYLYSGSLDSTIRVWLIPPPQHSTYSPYEPLTAQKELIGHTDAVWGLALLREGSLLVSCSADGTVKVWDVTSIPGALRLTWGYNGVGVDSASGSDEKDVIGATTVEAIKTNLKWVAVGYNDGVVKIFDVETGKEVAALQAEGAEPSQVNAITSHPALPLLVVGYEDKNIRVFDLSTFTCTHSMLSHLDAVTSLSLDPSGHALVSGSHDNSIRFWDLLGQKQCIQEDTKHRQKSEEGVLAVQFHVNLPFMASAGADGLVKIWASS
ncbi:hypothetical protein FRC19_007261 [Serendipita sp. 401]|nr:hypothetical protein FRC19_007261 [Serendipita sp. 401]